MSGEGNRPAADARAARLDELSRSLAEQNRPLVPTMTDARFDAMIARMAEHLLLFEEHAAGEGRGG